MQEKVDKVRIKNKGKGRGSIEAKLQYRLGKLEAD